MIDRSAWERGRGPSGRARTSGLVKSKSEPVSCHPVRAFSHEGAIWLRQGRGAREGGAGSRTVDELAVVQKVVVVECLGVQTKAVAV